MAIFDRNYDRDFGYHGGSGRHGHDRGLGDRLEGGLRRGWSRLNHGVRDAFDRDDDDRGYGYRGGAYGGSAYDREHREPGSGVHGANWGYGAGGGWQQRGAYDRDLGNRDWGGGRGMQGGARGMDRDDRTMFGGASHYDRDFGAADAGYDRDYKSRWQTDNGDPFGDRVNRTPIRMLRGGFRDRGDRGDLDPGMGMGRGFGAGSSGYDRDLMDRNRGSGYDPYQGDDVRGRGGWGMGNRNRGYDRGWF